MDKEIISRKVKNIKIYSFLCSGRTGSYFAVSLLDGHPQLITIFYAKIYHIYSLVDKKLCNDTNTSMSMSAIEIIDLVMQHPSTEDFFHPDLKIFNNIPIRKIDKATFRNHLIEVSNYVDMTLVRNFIIVFLFDLLYSIRY